MAENSINAGEFDRSGQNPSAANWATFRSGGQIQLRSQYYVRTSSSGGPIILDMEVCIKFPSDFRRRGLNGRGLNWRERIAVRARRKAT